jgi:hypothetical protein
VVLLSSHPAYWIRQENGQSKNALEARMIELPKPGYLTNTSIPMPQIEKRHASFITSENACPS